MRKVDLVMHKLLGNHEWETDGIDISVEICSICGETRKSPIFKDFYRNYSSTIYTANTGGTLTLKDIEEAVATLENNKPVSSPLYLLPKKLRFEYDET